MANKPSYEEFIRQHEEARREYVRRMGLDYDTYYHVNEHHETKKVSLTPEELEEAQQQNEEAEAAEQSAPVDEDALYEGEENEDIPEDEAEEEEYDEDSDEDEDDDAPLSRAGRVVGKWFGKVKEKFADDEEEEAAEAAPEAEGEAEEEDAEDEEPAEDEDVDILGKVKGLFGRFRKGGKAADEDFEGDFEGESDEEAEEEPEDEARDEEEEAPAPAQPKQTIVSYEDVTPAEGDFEEEISEPEFGADDEEDEEEEAPQSEETEIHPADEDEGINLGRAFKKLFGGLKRKQSAPEFDPEEDDDPFSTADIPDTDENDDYNWGDEEKPAPQKPAKTTSDTTTREDISMAIIGKEVLGGEKVLTHRERRLLEQQAKQAAEAVQETPAAEEPSGDGRPTKVFTRLSKLSEEEKAQALKELEDDTEETKTYVRAAAKPAEPDEDEEDEDEDEEEEEEA